MELARKTPKQRIEDVRDRLTAWADNAAWQLRNCDPVQENGWRNQRDNYLQLAATLETVIAEL